MLLLMFFILLGKVKGGVGTDKEPWQILWSLADCYYAVNRDALLLRICSTDQKSNTEDTHVDYEPTISCTLQKLLIHHVQKYILGVCSKSILSPTDFKYSCIHIFHLQSIYFILWFWFSILLSFFCSYFGLLWTHDICFMSVCSLLLLLFSLLNVFGRNFTLFKLQDQE